jgi:hypothetical protein
MALGHITPGYGPAADRPAASAMPGGLYHATDTGEVSKSNGSAWTLLPVSPTQITGLSGVLSCGGATVPVTTVGATGLLNVSSIVANVNSAADGSGDIKRYTIPALVDYQLTANQYVYVTVIYNGGSPIYSVITDNNLINHFDRIAVCQGVWEVLGAINEGHIFCVGAYGLGLSNKIGHRLIHTQRFGWESGLMLSESASRVINVSAGKVWYDGEEINIDITDTTTTNFHFYFHVAGVWSANLQSQFNNTQYDNGTNLVTLTNNHYAVNWVYRDIATDSLDVFVVIGNGDYSLTEAQTAQPPTSLPSVVAKQGILVGRIIVEKNASTATQVDSAFSTVFSPSGIISADAVVTVPAGTLTSQNAQASINELDAHQVRAAVHVNEFGFYRDLTQVTRDAQYGMSISYNPATWTFTLTDLGAGWSYYRTGIYCAITGNKTVVLNGGVTPAQPTKFFIYIDSLDGTLIASTVGWTLEDTKVPVATVTIGTGINVGGLAYLFAEERHSCLISRRDHYIRHYNDGTRWTSGGVHTVTTIVDTNPGSTDTLNAFGLSAALICDEDIDLTLDALADPTGVTNAYALAYRTAAGVYSFEDAQVPFRYNPAVNGIIYYDSGNGTQSSVSNGNYTNTYLLLTNIGTPGTQNVARFMIVQGRAQFSSLALAQAEDPKLYDWTGFGIAEQVIAYQLTWHVGTSKTTKGKVALAALPKRINASITTVSTLPTLGTMATQNSDNVSITGGSIALVALDQAVWTTTCGRGDTASKPAAAAGNAGYTYFDTDLGKLQRSNGSAWEDIAETGGGGGTTSYATNVGDGSNTTITVTHNLGTRDVHVTVYTNSGNYEENVVENRRTGVNTVDLVFSSAPALNAYRVVVTK